MSEQTQETQTPQAGQEAAPQGTGTEAGYLNGKYQSAEQLEAAYKALQSHASRQTQDLQRELAEFRTYAPVVEAVKNNPELLNVLADKANGERSADMPDVSEYDLTTADGFSQYMTARDGHLVGQIQNELKGTLQTERKQTEQAAARARVEAKLQPGESIEDLKTFARELGNNEDDLLAVFRARREQQIESGMGIFSDPAAVNQQSVQTTVGGPGSVESGSNEPLTPEDHIINFTTSGGKGGLRELLLG